MPNTIISDIAEWLNLPGVRFSQAVTHDDLTCRPAGRIWLWADVILELGLPHSQDQRSVNL